MFEFIRSNQLSIMLFLCGICATAGFLLLITRFMSVSRKKILIMMEVIAFLLLWFDRQAYIYSGDLSSKGYIMVRLSNFLVFFLTSGIVTGFNLYLTDWLMHEGNMTTPPKRLKFVQITSIIGMLLAVVSAFTGLYYYFDDMNKYHRGQGFLIAYIIPVICPLIQYTVIRQNKKLFGKLVYTSLVLYIFVPLVCGITQIFTYGISIVNMSMVMVSVFLYIFSYMDVNNTVERAHEIEIQNMQGENVKMQRLFGQTATAFVSAVETKDEYKKGNSEKIAQYARRIAMKSGMDEEECEKVYYAALLHDVGLIGIPDSVISKDQAPDDADYEILKKKPVIGTEILSSISEYPYLSVGAHYSHENYNGTGYPEGLKGAEIPETARIIAVADAYVDMTSPKRFREAMPDFAAREEILKGEGEEYDPKYSAIMINIIDEETNKKAVDDNTEIETEISCSRYREHATAGIVVDNDIKRITFEAVPLITGSGNDYSAPSIILFDSFDRRIHDNERTIDAYQYLEYGEIWFDGNSITTAARKIAEKVTAKDQPVKDGSQSYEITAGRYGDHLRLNMISPSYEKEVIVALPSISKSAYIAITGENCTITGISSASSGGKVGPDDIPRIAGEISYTDRLESDIKNVQIDTTCSEYTESVELKDRLRLQFHTMSLPGASLVWHCPYILIFSSDDGKVGGPNYREYDLVKLYGESNGDNEYAHNSITMKKTADFPGWDAWKDVNKEGMECEVTFRKKEGRITLKTANLGVEIENITTITDNPDKIHVALTGDECVLTDIRIK